MRRDEMKEQLQRIGANVSEKTLRRWGEADIIKDHQRHSSTFRPGRGRGNAEEWSEESFLQAAGVCAVSNASKKRLKISELESLRIMGDVIHKYGYCKLHYLNLNKLVERFSPKQSLRLPQDVFDMHLPVWSVSIVFDDDKKRNDLYSTYICAKEKAWHSMHSAERADWLITKPVRAKFYYTEEKIPHLDGYKPDWYEQIVFSHSHLEKKESGNDEPIFFFDGRDARAVPEHISIHIGSEEN